MTEPLQKKSPARTAMESGVAHTLPGVVTVVAHRIEQGMTAIEDSETLLRFHSYNKPVEVSTWGPVRQTIPKIHELVDFPNLDVTMRVSPTHPEVTSKTLRTMAIVMEQNGLAKNPSSYAGTIGQSLLDARHSANVMDQLDLVKPEKWPPGKIRAITVGYFGVPEAYVVKSARIDMELFSSSRIAGVISNIFKDTFLLKGPHVLAGPALSAFFCISDAARWDEQMADPENTEMVRNFYTASAVMSGGAFAVESADVIYNGLGVYRHVAPFVTPIRAAAHGAMLGKTAIGLGGAAGLAMQVPQFIEMAGDPDVTTTEEIAVVAGGVATTGAMAVILLPLNLAPGAGTLTYIGLLFVGGAGSVWAGQLSEERHAAKRAHEIYKISRKVRSRISPTTPENSKEVLALRDIFYTLSADVAESLLDEMISVEGMASIKTLPRVVKRTLIARLQTEFLPNQQKKDYIAMLLLSGAFEGDIKKIDAHIKHVLAELDD